MTTTRSPTATPAETAGPVILAGPNLDERRQGGVPVGARKQDREDGQAQDREAQRRQPAGDAAQRQPGPEPQGEERGHGQPNGHDRVQGDDAGHQPGRSGHQTGDGRGPGQEGRPGGLEGRGQDAHRASSATRPSPTPNRQGSAGTYGGPARKASGGPSKTTRPRSSATTRSHAGSRRGSCVARTWAWPAARRSSSARSTASVPRRSRPNVGSSRSRTAGGKSVSAARLRRRCSPWLRRNGSFEARCPRPK